MILRYPTARSCASNIKYHKPKFFLLENVKNLLSHDKGKTFKTIRNVLENELGYTIQYRILDAKGLVPQHRERIFIVGSRERTNFDFDSLLLPDPHNGPKLSEILHPENGSEHLSEQDLKNAYILEDGSVNPKYTLSDKLWNYLQGYAEKHRKKGNGFGFGLVSKDDVARTLSARYHKDGSEILIKQEGKNPRRLTPRECARLQGYSDDFKITVSDTQAYRQFGNSVAVPVIRLIANVLYPHIIQRNSILKSLKIPA